MRTVADAAQAVQGWNPQSGGEVAIRATAYRRFAEFPPQIARNPGAIS